MVANKENGSETLVGGVVGGGMWNRRRVIREQMVLLVDNIQEVKQYYAV